MNHSERAARLCLDCRLKMPLLKKEGARFCSRHCKCRHKDRSRSDLAQRRKLAEQDIRAWARAQCSVV